MLRGFILDKVIGPLSEEAGSSPTHTALVMALLTGVAIFRDVLRVRPLIEAKGGELEALIAQVIQLMIDSFGCGEIQGRSLCRQLCRL